MAHYAHRLTAMPLNGPFEDRRFRVLVYLYTLHQFGHVLLNLQYFVWPVLEFPFPPERGAWHGGVVHVFNAMGVVDTVSAFGGLVFAVAYLLGHRWSLWVGLVSLANYMNSMALLTYLFYATAAWRRYPVNSVVIYVSFLPAPILFVWMCIIFHRASRDAFQPVGRPAWRSRRLGPKS
jgi:hypothetical protein